MGPDGASGAGAALEALLAVRRTLLSNLPRIMATLTDLWRLIGETEEFNSSLPLSQDKYKKYNSFEEEKKKKEHQQLLWILGSPKVYLATLPHLFFAKIKLLIDCETTHFKFFKSLIRPLWLSLHGSCFRSLA